MICHELLVNHQFLSKAATLYENSSKLTPRWILRRFVLNGGCRSLQFVLRLHEGGCSVSVRKRLKSSPPTLTRTSNDDPRLAYLKTKVQSAKREYDRDLEINPLSWVQKLELAMGCVAIAVMCWGAVELFLKLIR